MSNDEGMTRLRLAAARQAKSKITKHPQRLSSFEHSGFLRNSSFVLRHFGESRFRFRETAL
jgi:hypothetical protein